jgi:hypothetical protein
MQSVRFRTIPYSFRTNLHKFSALNGFFGAFCAVFRASLFSKIAAFRIEDFASDFAFFEDRARWKK